MAGSARRALINTLIGSLSLAAFLAIVVLLSGEDTEGAGRVLLTCFAVALYSATSLAGLSTAARAPARQLALVIWSLSAAGFLTAALAIWDPNEGEGAQRLAWAVAVAAVCAAQLGLLAARVRAQDHRAIRVGEVLTAAAALMLAVLVVWAIASGNDNERYLRAVGVVGIADAYGLCVIPLMRLLQREARPAGARGGLLVVLVAVLTVAAAAGIVGLVGNSVDEDLGRVLATLPFAALCGATALAGVVVRRLPRHELLGGLTILASGFALAAVLNVIWVSDFTFGDGGGGEADYEWAWTLVVLACTLAHVSVLIARQRPGDTPTTTTLVRWAVAAASVAGLLLVYPVVDDGVGPGYVVWVAVVVILDVLASSLVALVRKRDSAPA